ncbi:hypothetical protein [Rhizobium phage RHph_X2_25]|nr:hypothetical protein [Rhizobium phage RHph_X2_25]
MMGKFTKFIDDLAPEDMTPERIDAISKEAASRLIEKHGPGRIETRHHEGFEDGYNWIEVTLHQSRVELLEELISRRKDTRMP